MSEPTLLPALGGAPAPSPAVGGGPGGRNASARWRLELERAQLAVKVRAAPDASQAPAQRQAASGDPETRGSLPQKDEQAGPTRDAEGRTAPRAPASDADPGESSPGLPRATLASSDPVPEGESPRAESPQQRAASGAPATARAARPARPVWPAFKVLASCDGEAVQVCIRDASLAEARLRELAARLRLELRSAGRRLARLTVNGHDVISEETDPWQSTR